MLVIHGLWLREGRLAIWAEQAGGPATAARRPGRPPRERPHPSAAPRSVLRAALGELLTTAGASGAPAPPDGQASPEGQPSGPLPDEATPIVQAIQLPTRRRVPLDSPELIRTDPTESDAPAGFAAADAPPAGSGAADRAPVRLAVWQVPALAFDASAALRLLRALPERGPAAGRLVPGASLRHLVELADFALDLVSRGRVLPALVGDQARWRPVLTGADRAWARALALALPPATLAAVSRPPASTDGVASVGGVFADLLDRLTDAATRSALRGVRLIDARRASGLDAATRAWLRALTEPDATVTADPTALAALDGLLGDWRRGAASGAVRACFRLVEPTDPTEPTGPVIGGDSAAWRVEFLLQAAEEPSLLVGADQVWATRGPLKGLAGHLDSPHETLLAELGRASRLWPELTDALRTATPTGLGLDVVGAHRFLRDGAPVLHAAGFGVLLPSWWQRPANRLGARLRASGRTAPGTVATRSSFGMDALVDYEWEVALGDTALSVAELRALAKLKTPLVRFRGQWVELDPKRLAAGLRLLRSGGELTVGELLQLGLSGQDDGLGLPVLEISADGALGDLLTGQVERRLTPVDEPPGFRGSLRPYQKRGLAWLGFLQSLGLGGILADDMGLGKTVQLLALLATDPPQAGPTLLICPMSLVGNWQREAARFAPGLRVRVHHGAHRARAERVQAVADEADLVLTTYPTVARDAVALAGIDWHRVVIDEAQAIKNAATRQANAVRALPARHRVAITGTPVENRLADLWSIMEFANPGLLGPASVFRKRYAEPVERHGDEQAAQRLRRITGPFVLRRLKTDSTIITDLPEKLEMEVLCNLTAEQASLYQAVVDDALDRIEHSTGIERRGLVLATMTKLKQVCNHPALLLRDESALDGRSGKLARLEGILDEVLAAGEQALLFTQYAGFGAALRAHLVARFGREVLFLHGGVGKRDRDTMVERFQRGDAELFILSLRAGGTGLTLTAANHVLHVDRWWNPAVEDQATDRAYRIGQRRNVQVRKFVCAGTVEEKVAELISGKRGLAARIVGTGEQWLTELSTGQLRELFALESSAVAR